MKKGSPAHTAATKGGPMKGDWHVNHSSMGMGDYYGTGIRAPLGKMRDGMGMKEITPTKLKNAPRSLA
jgi:hypothetical protein